MFPLIPFFTSIAYTSIAYTATDRIHSLETVFLAFSVRGVDQRARARTRGTIEIRVHVHPGHGGARQAEVEGAGGGVRHVGL